MKQLPRREKQAWEAGVSRGTEEFVNPSAAVPAGPTEEVEHWPLAPPPEVDSCLAPAAGYRE